MSSSYLVWWFFPGIPFPSAKHIAIRHRLITRTGDEPRKPVQTARFGAASQGLFDVPAARPRRSRGPNLAKLAPVSSTPRIALVAGATGLVGGYLIQALLEAPEYSRVYALTRRPFGREHPKLANRIVVYARMAEQLKGTTAHDAFCCVGTTIAAAGSQEAFREADVEAVLQFARAARTAGATRFVVVSSVGADAASSKFYLRTKGEMEQELAGVGFASLDILQPSLLLGPRRESRPLETLARIFAPLINPLLTGSREAYRAIPAETVARAMVGAARRGGRGVYRYTYAAIRQLAELRPNVAPAAAPPKNKPA
jgi:uncharacterized protein YbjT (DUF2867 family)